MSTQSIHSSRLSTEAIPQLVRELSIPVSIGFFFLTMYNVVDNWVAGKLSTEALAGLTASFPVFFLITAVSHGSQAATNALVSHALGKNDTVTARKLGGQAVFFAAWMSLLTGILGWWGCPWLFHQLGISGEPLELAIQYMRVIFLATPCFVIGAACNGTLSAHGNTKPFRNVLFAGFLLNIVLDLWFVFGGMGLPAFGFAGIAWATFLVQMGSLTYLLITTHHHGLFPRRIDGGFHPRLRLQKNLMSQGFPALFNMLTIAAGIFVFTFFAAQVSVEVLAAYGTATRIEQIALLPTIGLNTAALTLAGHSLGAGRLDRLRETVWTCWKDGLVIYAIGAPIVAGFAPFWMGLFTKDPEVIRIGTTFLRIAMLMMYAFVLLFISTSALQGIQRPQFAVWIGIFRQILMPLLLVPFLMNILNPPETGIWWGAFISVWTGTLITLAYIAWVWKRLRAESPCPR